LIGSERRGGQEGEVVGDEIGEGERRRRRRSDEGSEDSSEETV